MIYDVGEKRVNKILKIGRRYLNWVQNSVLEGDLSPAVFAQLKSDVGKKIDKEYDSVIFYTWRSERYTTREIMGIERGNMGVLI
jgi:CRISPR-associated protein Cas2